MSKLINSIPLDLESPDHKLNLISDPLIHPEINQLIPQILHNKLNYMHFFSDFNDPSDTELYTELSSSGDIIFKETSKLVSLHIDYSIYKSSYWNENDIDITLYVKNGHKEKNYNIKFLCKRKQINNDSINIITITNIDKLLRYLDLDITIDNKKTVGIFLNNIVWKTKSICNPNKYNYCETIIDCNNDKIDKNTVLSGKFLFKFK
nr:exodeoxyribonuclease 7 large subunit [Megavirus caiporensis]